MSVSPRPVPRRASWVTSLGVVVLCAPGCTGSLLQSKAVAPAVYLLSVPGTPDDKTSAGAAILPVDLGIQRPRVRVGLDTERIAVLYPDHRLDYYAAARWSGTLDVVVQDLTVQSFRGAGLRNVSADASEFSSTHWLEVEVLDFQAEYAKSGGAPTIHVRLAARLGGAGDRRLLGALEAHAEQPASDNRLTAIVDAYEHAAAAAMSQIVAGTQRLLGASENR